MENFETICMWPTKGHLHSLPKLIWKKKNNFFNSFGDVDIQMFWITKCDTENARLNEENFVRKKRNVTSNSEAILLKKFRLKRQIYLKFIDVRYATSI